MIVRAPFGILTAVLAVAASSIVPVNAQQTSRPSATLGTSASVPVARTPEGQPDLQGVWGYATITPMERPDNLGGRAVLTDEEAEEQNEDARTRNDRAPTGGSPGTYNSFWWDRGQILPDRRASLVVDPPDGRVPPLTTEAQQRQTVRAAGRTPGPPAGPEDRSLWERCLTRTLPTLPGAYNNNIQIVQSREYVVILNEMIHEARIIPLDGRPNVGAPQWRGESRGRWEGDTLVVETVNFNEKTNFRGSNVKLKLVERYSRVDADTLLHEVTINDPTTWARPWTVSFPMTRNEELIYEYACHEGNYGMFGILAGARADDERAVAGGR
jgi:hypothetical protein